MRSRGNNVPAASRSARLLARLGSFDWTGARLPAVLRRLSREGRTAEGTGDALRGSLLDTPSYNCFRNLR